MRASTKGKLAGIGVLLLVGAWFGNPNCDVDWYDVRVTDKQVKKMGDTDTYMIFTVDAKGNPHVFKDVDTKLFMKLDSSNLYAKMEVGRWYHVKTVGWRWSLKSWYENVLKAEPIQPPAGAAAP